MSLRSFLKQMETKGEILHVKDTVSTRFEVPFIMKECDNKGLIPLLKNRKIIGRKSLPPFAQLEKESVKHGINQNELYSSLVETWRSLQKTRILEDGVVKEITEKPGVSKIPILTHFKKDADPHVTSAVIHAKNVDATRPLTKPGEKSERAKIPVSKHAEGLVRRLLGQ